MSLPRSLSLSLCPDSFLPLPLCVLCGSWWSGCSPRSQPVIQVRARLYASCADCAGCSGRADLLRTPRLLIRPSVCLCVCVSVCLLCRVVVFAAAAAAGGWSSVALPSSAVWFLVCSHALRDRRCGLHGPLLLSAMEEALAQRGQSEAESRLGSGAGDGVALLECSHLNGHRYAAICVAIDSSQRRPQWYGCVRPSDAPLLLKLHVDAEAAESGEDKAVTQQWIARHER